MKNINWYDSGKGFKIQPTRVEAQSYPQITQISQITPVKSASLHIFDIFNRAGRPTQTYTDFIMCEGMAVVVCPLSVVSFDRRGFVATGVNLMRRENQVKRSYQAVAKVYEKVKMREDLIHPAGTPSKNHPVF